MPIHKPKLMEKVFFLFSGGVISIPFSLLAGSLVSYFLHLNLPNYLAELLSIVILGPLLEEFAKAYPLFYRHGETERSLFSLGFLTGLGFGIVEFFIYVFFLGTPLLIRLPIILFHATNTSIIAYGIARKRVFVFFFIVFGLHFLNNYSALQGGIWAIGSFIALISSFVISLFLFKRSEEKTIFD